MEEEERKNLNSTEYNAMLAVFGFFTQLENELPNLEKRLRMRKDAWRKAKLMEALGEKLVQELLTTIPRKKLGLIYKELKNVHCTTKVEYTVAPKKDENFLYVPEKQFMQVLGHCMNNECMICDKTGATAKGCKLKKDIQACYPWDFELVNDACPLAGSYMEKEE